MTGAGGVTPVDGTNPNGLGRALSTAVTGSRGAGATSSGFVDRLSLIENPLDDVTFGSTTDTIGAGTTAATGAGTGATYSSTSACLYEVGVRFLFVDTSATTCGTTSTALIVESSTGAEYDGAGS